MKKPFFSKAVLSAFSLTLCTAFFLLLSLPAHAEFVPQGMKTIGTLKGQWGFKPAFYSTSESVLPRAPMVDFSSGYNNILINFDGKLPPHVQDSVNAAISDTYFGCNGENFKLWFNTGAFIPLEVGRCDHGRIYLHIPIGTGSGLWESYRKTADLISHGGRPVMLSEGMSGLKLSYSDDSPLKAFRKATDPKTNPSYFESVQKYWAQFEQKHAVNAISQSDFVPLDTEVIGSLKGEWAMKTDAQMFPSDQPNPAVVFSAGPMQIAIVVSGREKDILNPKGPVPADLVHMTLCNLYFKCNAGGVKLWFDNGQYIETGSTVCLGDSIFATSSKGEPTDKEAEEEKRLAVLLKTNRPVALSQGKYAVSLDYHDRAALDEFRKESDPKTNPSYFEQKKKYFQTRDKDKKASKKG